MNRAVRRFSCIPDVLHSSLLQTASGSDTVCHNYILICIYSMRLCIFLSLMSGFSFPPHIQESLCSFLLLHFQNHLSSSSVRTDQEFNSSNSMHNSHDQPTLSVHFCAVNTVLFICLAAFKITSSVSVAETMFSVNHTGKVFSTMTLTERSMAKQLRARRSAVCSFLSFRLVFILLNTSSCFISWGGSRTSCFFHF